MDYPINMQTDSDAPGFALANNEEEHRALSAAGYMPAFEEPADDAQTVEDVRAKLGALGIEYDKRFGLEKLLALIPA